MEVIYFEPNRKSIINVCKYCKRGTIKENHIIIKDYICENCDKDIDTKEDEKINRQDDCQCTIF